VDTLRISRHTAYYNMQYDAKCAACPPLPMNGHFFRNTGSCFLNNHNNIELDLNCNKVFQVKSCRFKSVIFVVVVVTGLLFITYDSSSLNNRQIVLPIAYICSASTFFYVMAF